MRNTSPLTSNRKELRCWIWQRAKVLIRVGPDARLASQAFDLSTDGGDNLGHPFTIECAEADKSSHVPPSDETPTRLSWCGCVAAAGENGQPTRRRFAVGASPTRQTLQPEATGTVMEVTKWLKPLVSVSRIGDCASVQAVTRVITEQASFEYFHQEPS